MGNDHEPVLRLGLIGLGSAGTHMARGLVGHPGVKAVGAADRIPELRERFAQDFGCDSYEDAAELCARPDVDAIYIATPHHFHKDHAIMAANHGKHVVVEKPMALTLAECDAMIEAARVNGVSLIIGPTHSFDPLILTMGQVLRSGELGKLGMINAFNYTDFLYRPRRPEELDTSKGGGILFNQIPHQVDIIRYLSGGKVRSVRAWTGMFDPNRPTEGACMAFLSLEGGAAAHLLFNGYDHFDSDEFHFWVGEGGQPKGPKHGATRKALGINSREEEAKLRTARYGYGKMWSLNGDPSVPDSYKQPHFGVVIASCERGDVRPLANSVAVYGDEGAREVPVAPSHSMPGRSETIDELYAAWRYGRPPIHDGAWGKATLEVCLAIQQSAREQREIYLEHQVEGRFDAAV